MTTATLTSKGQITVPKQVRDQLHLSTGDRVRFLTDGEGRVVMVPATISITELRGCLPAPAFPGAARHTAPVLGARGSPDDFLAANSSSPPGTHLTPRRRRASSAHT